MRYRSIIILLLWCLLGYLLNRFYGHFVFPFEYSYYEANSLKYSLDSNPLFNVTIAFMIFDLMRIILGGLSLFILSKVFGDKIIWFIGFFIGFLAIPYVDYIYLEFYGRSLTGTYPTNFENPLLDTFILDIILIPTMYLVVPRVVPNWVKSIKIWKSGLFA